MEITQEKTKIHTPEVLLSMLEDAFATKDMYIKQLSEANERLKTEVSHMTATVSSDTDFINENKMLRMKVNNLQRKCEKLASHLKALPYLVQHLGDVPIIHANEKGEEPALKCITTYAQDCGCPYAKLIKLLKEKNILLRYGHTWLLHKSYHGKGYAVYLFGTQYDYTRFDLMWTAKGMEFLDDFVRKHLSTKGNKRV